MTGESVEQAALRRARKDSRDWKGHAEREAAAFLAGLPHPLPLSRIGQEWMVAVLAAMWLQGVNYGAHDTLNQAELAFDRARAEL